MIIGGALLIGIGVGLLVDQEGPGTLIGLGIGMIVEEIVRRSRRERRSRERSSSA